MHFLWQQFQVKIFLGEKLDFSQKQDNKDVEMY